MGIGEREKVKKAWIGKKRVWFWNTFDKSSFVIEDEKKLLTQTENWSKHNFSSSLNSFLFALFLKFVYAKSASISE